MAGCISIVLTSSLTGRCECMKRSQKMGSPGRFPTYVKKHRPQLQTDDIKNLSFPPGGDGEAVKTPGPYARRTPMAKKIHTFPTSDVRYLAPHWSRMFHDVP
ncbi:hypothetical protein TWF706_000070 [Orbilia oligospora]|nr:hypothetical protein TWF706_000070 [Orbilia oligospora]